MIQFSDKQIMVRDMVSKLAKDRMRPMATDAVQILGGYGIMKEYSVERMMRDAKAT